LLDGIPLFNSPRHARGLLADAIIPLSVAVAKVKAAINPLKILIGLRR
jgi:hypothetical protein